jgi:hypothetical protein
MKRYTIHLDGLDGPEGRIVEVAANTSREARQAAWDALEDHDRDNLADMEIVEIGIEGAE